MFNTIDSWVAEVPQALAKSVLLHRSSCRYNVTEAFRIVKLSAPTYSTKKSKSVLDHIYCCVTCQLGFARLKVNFPYHMQPSQALTFRLDRM